MMGVTEEELERFAKSQRMPSGEGIFDLVTIGNRKVDPCKAFQAVLVVLMLCWLSFIMYVVYNFSNNRPQN